MEEVPLYVRIMDHVLKVIESDPYRTGGLQLRINCKREPPVEPNSILDLTNQGSLLACVYDRAFKRCAIHEAFPVVFGSQLYRRYFIDGDEVVQRYGSASYIKGGVKTYPMLALNNNQLAHTITVSDMRMVVLYIYTADEYDSNPYSIRITYNAQRDLFEVRDRSAKDFLLPPKVEKDASLWEKVLDLMKRPVRFMPLSKYIAGQRIELLPEKVRRLGVPQDWKIDDAHNKCIYDPFHITLVGLQGQLALLERLHEMFAKDPTITVELGLEALGKPKPESSAQSSGQRKRNVGIIFKNESKNNLARVLSGKFLRNISSKMKLKCDSDSQGGSKFIQTVTEPRSMEGRCHRPELKNVSPQALCLTDSYIGFVDSVVQADMERAGKNFNLTTNVRPTFVDFWGLVRLLDSVIERELLYDRDDERGELYVYLNTIPTHLRATETKLIPLFEALKANRAQVELRFWPEQKVLQINHCPGMLTKCMANTGDIEYTAMEIYSRYSLVNQLIENYGYDIEKPLDRMKRGGAEDFMSVFTLRTLGPSIAEFLYIPASKSFVTMSNRKNHVHVFRVGEYEPSPPTSSIPDRYAVVVWGDSYLNEESFALWTIVGDFHNGTTEDPFIPSVDLPFQYLGELSYNLRFVTTEKSGFRVNMSLGSSTPNGAGWYAANFGYIIVPRKVIRDGAEYPNDVHVLSKKRLMVVRTESADDIILRISAWNTLDSEPDWGNFWYSHNGEDHSTKSHTLDMRFNVKYTNIEGLKICSIHGQKGVLAKPMDFSEFRSPCGVVPQIAMSPLAYLKRQTTFNQCPQVSTIVRGIEYTIVKVPYSLFMHSTSYIRRDYDERVLYGQERAEGARTDMYTISNVFHANSIPLSMQAQRHANSSAQRPMYNYEKFHSLVSTLGVCVERKGRPKRKANTTATSSHPRKFKQ
ncbi:CUN026 putative lef-8 late transcription factor, Rna_Pol_Beta motif, similar to AcMNPV ORF50 [Culex nigripalpus nucleopolyhedrovirus]|uniref:CUN026 putative lef-8 late transcription factor, Rna_Pol_Beta motif, similar to AcMNPV ORF50 n=1 Tax=Culex nigripalpus nucleopolyhedrovirus (isolate Florida/1997) TaxID=645993 RepID=Q919P3_NPVCO|nr:CUN026 putative lef-8 late transcription factor, Rna_Pol_Beta motif, similar to AcMNPV ORF50 [Culex nigripalpus nucleopolyhedrovirus]AAK94104.1 CUN026 putative lef-8 late transcription factor, Rna_Pol_Beta motif, similar to AcMNPV ORF50 [Culex nigripalpus nucleopolyhedrovirus]